jgi:oxygen-independent coproporphyrinogen-3 oxidase
VLTDLGRRHRGADLREAAGWLGLAQRRGDLASWSLDLIQGLPGQDLAHWDGQLRQALALEPPHLSVYDLSIEPGTVFERRLASGELMLPPDDLAADLMELTWARLTAAGYGHYEVSNYAQPGHASRHNRVYWSGAGWWGFGMGATGAPRGRRRAHPRTRAGYAESLAVLAGGEVRAGADSAQKSREMAEEAAREAVGMPFDELLLVGLRRREGVNLERLGREQGLAATQLQDLRRRLAAYERRGLLCVEGPRWRLADPAGLALSNGVLREMLAWWQELPPPERCGAPAR